MGIFGKSKEEKRKKLLALWEALKKTNTLTLYDIETIIREQSDLSSAAAEELFMHNFSLQELFNVFFHVQYKAILEKHCAETSVVIGKKLIEKCSTDEDFEKFLIGCDSQDLKEEVAEKVLES